MDAKPSTIDVDFTILGKDYEEFERAKKIVQPGFRVDVFRDGAVFVTVLVHSGDQTLESAEPQHVT